MSWFLFSIATTVGSLIWFVWMYRYWPKRNVTVLPPKMQSALAITNVTMARMASKNYEDMRKKGIKFSGIFNVFRPILVVVDLDIIREILTDPPREHFWDIGYHYIIDIVLRSRDLVELDGRNWEDMCRKLTPDCSLKSMKTIMQSILISSEIMSETLVKYAVEGRDIDVKEFLACFTTDLIGLECYNIKCNSFNNSEIRSQQWPVLGGLTRNFKFNRIFKNPRLCSSLGMKASEEELSLFIHDRIRNLLKSYEQCERGAYAADLHLYINEYHKELKHLHSFCHMIGQNTFFFYESFDLLSSTLYFAIYELCRNPGVQAKARKEIQAVLRGYGDKICEESLAEMEYLQLVIYETLRMYPPVANFLRLCVEDYKVTNELTIKPRTQVVIPLFAIHRDPRFCSKPDEFMPERFHLENKDLHPQVYMPYGEGTRHCLSIHAGLSQCKIGLVDVLRKCTLTMSPRTESPLRLDPEAFMKSIGRLYVRAGPIRNEL